MKISHDIRDSARAEAEQGMAEMSKKFRETGGEIDIALKP
jgi:phosphomethylpyrimidine synthase